MAKEKQPYIPIYIGDWLKDMDDVSLEGNGAWLNLVFKLWDSKDKGRYSTDFRRLGYLWKCGPQRAEIILKELLEKNICDIEFRTDSDVMTIISRRMLREKEIAKKRSKAGKVGGKMSRNTQTKRLYTNPGYLYLIYDRDDPGVFKVGISKDPEKRIRGIRIVSKRPNMQFRRKWKVSNMGKTEDAVLNYFDDIRDGEWIYGDYDIEEIESEVSAIVDKHPRSVDNHKNPKSKQNQNPDNDIDYGNRVEKEKGYGKKEEVFSDGVITPFPETDFVVAWDVWKEYLDENFETRIAGMTEQEQLRHLDRISGSDCVRAISIISQSIRNGWKDLYELKENGKSTGKGKSGYSEEFLRALAADKSI